MTILSRLSNLVQQTAEDLIARTEGPEAALDRLLADLEQAIASLHDQQRQTEASITATTQGITRLRQSQAVWEQQAEEAVHAGDDGTAREALRHCRNEAQREASQQAQLAELQETAAQLQQKSELLENRTEAARRRRDLLVARLQTAQLRQRTDELCRKVDRQHDGIREDGLEGAFEELEHRLATIEALGDLAGAAPPPNVDQELEDELAALKKKAKAPKRGRKGR